MSQSKEKKSFRTLGVLCAILLTPVLSVSAAEFDPNFIISDRDMTNKSVMSLDAVQAFLVDKRGALGSYVAQDLDGVSKRASDIIYRVSQEFLLNPRFLLVMLQKEQSLVTDPTPKQGQYDWATGYAVCDACNVNASGVSRYKGFAKQVDSMAQQFRLGYLPALEELGETQTRLAPGRETTIDGRTVTPVNNATAALYTYTPHIEGNQNFWRIWNTWFDTADYPSGTLLRDIQDGSIWLIKFGRRRHIASQAILASFYDPASVIEVDHGTILAYEEGKAIAFPNYSLVRVETGDVYLLVNDSKRRFISLSDIARFGYAPEEVIDAQEADLADYQMGTSISYDTAYPQGAVLQHPETKSLFYVLNGVRHAIVSEDILKARYASWRVRPSTIEELASYSEGAAITFPDGTLVMVDGNPTVYVISDGKRRPIISEDTFLGLGYKWEHIIRTTPASVEVHAPGMLLSITQ
ncbi:hypothetical protein COV06_00900 [Candidatus Uhrbacteria bacterium CG10_big_fil_rev_8_21_14_0_10_50_16]|uniref:Hemagglutinin-related protein n=1 Tax=Candidatus Uhrbacteria bacterium CG10_big_fil_rev_8_21_14_0_10_50_16 TaxID=1975039 RepID=A0A2H0RPN1_9BACT|nr:MAG: hypothetical protein COV06_00900 [Candidatus Uhrbacteria bacterium CG10_big_fil_rev_8_21_14_0_10_50_16]